VADLINLRRARKTKERAAREQTASEKRSLFGRTKAQKQAEATTRERAKRAIDDHRRDKS
jgi:Domain of unknown function (DUF4169)